MVAGACVLWIIAFKGISIIRHAMTCDRGFYRLVEVPDQWVPVYNYGPDGAPIITYAWVPAHVEQHWVCTHD